MHTWSRHIPLSLSLLSLALLSACPLGPGKLGELAETGESGDADGDPGACFGDGMDLCPMTPGQIDTADADHDGVGDDCDNCRRAVEVYNLDGVILQDPRMRVRNAAAQGDFDHDGIGDGCDNCVVEPNCESVGPDADLDAELCQTDQNADMIGDACTGDWDQEHAAGPVGFGANDDFDQDGIINAEDACPRHPIAADYGQRLACVDDIDCTPDASVPGDCVIRQSAITGWCNHVDHDGDGVGDVCDSCPLHPNPDQEAGDACELCPQAFEPGNQPHVDGRGTTSPERGRVRHGVFEDNIRR